ncbi:MAG: serine/threonine-protein kinase, partial [Myxococcota bacterium]
MADLQPSRQDEGLDSFEQRLKQILPSQHTPVIQPGHVIAATYMLMDLLGAGGMGRVFRARHLRTDGEVALKLIRASLLSSPRAAKRFELEARHTASLNHPHIVTVMDYGRDDALLYLVMELCPGHNLQTRLAQQGPMEWEEVVQITAQVLMALQAAHASQRCLIHRDIKPANILVQELSAGVRFAKVVDFGISVATHTGHHRDGNNNAVVGSPQTMA